MKLPISSIAVINRQRKEIDKKKLEELASSIESSGLLHPIVVRDPFDFELSQLKQGQTKVLCVGGRRLAAHLMLGRDQIEANDKSDLDPLSAEIVELEENIVRADISWQEQLDARARIHALRVKQNPLQTISDTEQELGLVNADGSKTGQLNRDLKLHEAIKADPSLKQATSKASAIRMAKHREHVAEREKVALSVKGSDIAKKLLTMDGRDLIRTLPDQSVNLVFSDLPYGIDYFVGAKSGENMKGQYDDSAESAKDFIADIVPQIVRVVKPDGWIVLFMCYEWHMWLQESLLNACTVHAGYRETISATSCNALKTSAEACHFLRPELPPWIWTRRGKGNHGHYPELHASNRYEMLVVVNGGKAHLTKKPVENVLDFAPFSDERLHAMQKPHDLCCEIIDRTTVPGELVLDICMGSGAHLAAAASKGRDFLGCDKNPDNLGAALGLVSQYYHRGMK